MQTMRRQSPTLNSGTNNSNSSGWQQPGSRRPTSPAVAASTVGRTRSPVVGSFTPNAHYPHHHQQRGATTPPTSSAQHTPRTTAAGGAAVPMPGSSALRIKNMHAAAVAGGGGAPSGSSTGRSPRPGSTPTSARSASVITDLEGAIAATLQHRMQSLAESRKRVEELALLHQRETDAFTNEMGQILAQSAMASGAQRDMQEDYESMLERAHAEKSKLLEILQRFKMEGDRVTGDLKRALADEREKHKEQMYRNEHLLQKVREMQATVKKQQGQIEQLQQQVAAASAAAPRDGVPPLAGQRNSSSNNGAASASTAASDEHMIALVELLREHERVIDELERRNRNLEHDLRYQASKARLSQAGINGDGGAFSGGDLTLNIPDNVPSTSTPQQQLNALIQQFAATTPSEPSSASSSSAMPIESMTQLVRGLLHQLRNENRMRLRVEEQSTKLVADQDEQIRKLEARLREYEASSTSNGGLHLQQQQQQQQQQLGKIGVGSPSPARPGQMQRRPMSPTSSTGAGAGFSVAATTTVKSRIPGGAPVPATGAAGVAPTLPRLSGAGGSGANSGTNSGTTTPPSERVVHQPAPTAHSTVVVPSSLPAPAPVPTQQQPKRQPAIGLEGYDEDEDEQVPPPRQQSQPQQQTRRQSVPNDDAEFLPTEGGNGNQARGQRGASSPKAPSVSVSELNGGPSLEEQLAEVANSFNESIDTWQAAAGPVSSADAEFEPEPRH